ncbi:MAG: glycosyltransferase [Paludibacteraceae bacterium]|nr:glycosyltransferase [Paludibacteraceae bacterium]
MKIVIIGPAWPYRGGIADFNERIAKEYISNGHEVDLITFTLQYPSFLFPGKTQFCEKNKPEWLHVERKINSINPFNWIKVGNEIKNKNYDLAIIKFWLPFLAPCLGTIARIIKRNKKTKTISILDNLVPHEKRPMDRILSSYFVNSIDSFIAMSQSVMNDLLTFDTKKAKLLSPHPLYDNFGEKESRENALKHLHLFTNFRYILFFGFIRDYKGLDLLLKAFAQSKLYQKNIKLLVAGEFYNNSKQYFDLEKELNLNGHIEWRSEFIEENEVKHYFCGADIIAQTYKTATQSGVTQIAYHFEKPMLVTNVGGLSEIVPHGKVGYSVDANIESIKNALLDFYEKNPDFTKGIQEEKKKYSWEEMINKVNLIIT